MIASLAIGGLVLQDSPSQASEACMCDTRPADCFRGKDFVEILQLTVSLCHHLFFPNDAGRQSRRHGVLLAPGRIVGPKYRMPAEGRCGRREV